MPYIVQARAPEAPTRTPGFVSTERGYDERITMRHVTTLLYVLALLFLLAACGTTVQPEDPIGAAPSFDITTLALDPTVIDFETGLQAGDIVDAVSGSRGMSGADAGGFVGVLGLNPDLPGTNSAMIFDATCNGRRWRCSGDDRDLYRPESGNVLIVSEDGDSSDPDDAHIAGTSIEFDFTTWGNGVVAIGVLSTTVLTTNDIDGVPGAESGAFVRLYGASGALLEELPILATGDRGTGTVQTPINHTDVARMTVWLNGSGAVDDITIATDFPEGGQGCDVRYWPRRANWSKWVGYRPGDSFDTAFGVTSSDGDTLLQALRYNGPREQALQRQAVAALLNANAGIGYLYTRAEVIALVQQAYARGWYGGIKNLLRFQNEMVCPLLISAR